MKYKINYKYKIPELDLGLYLENPKFVSNKKKEIRATFFHFNRYFYAQEPEKLLPLNYSEKSFLFNEDDLNYNNM